MGPRTTRKHTPHRNRERTEGQAHRNTRREMRRDDRRGGRSLHFSKPKQHVPIPPPGPETVRIVPLGGVEEVGRNMTVVETKDDIFVVDAGFQFMSEGDAPGIDYVLPNTTYLEERKGKIRALIITHGHLDHIGGIPFIVDRIGNPPIYTRELTAIMIQKRQEEFPHLPKLDIRIMGINERVKIGSTHVASFPVTHSIPDSMGIKIETKYGNVLLTGDLKLDHVDGIPTEAENKNFTELGKENNLFFIADSTNAERSGFSLPEKQVHKNLEEILRNVKGRLIIGTFASQFERIIKIIEAAERYNKKVVTEGRSIKTNIEIAQRSGILKVNKDTIIPAQEIDNYPAERLVILATGAQGEEFAALMRIATKKHKSIRLTERDTVVLSSSVIPGNEIAVQRLKDNLYRNGVRIIHYRASDVHSTGHGNAGELTWINQKIGAKYFMPAYGYHSMLRCHAQAVMDAGFPKERIILPDNGTVIDIEKGEQLNIHKDKAPSGFMMVDGLAIGNSQEVVIRDRQMLAKDGIFMIVTIINLKTGKLKKSPDLISRGFVYIRESQQLFQETRLLVKKTVEDATSNMNPINFDYIKEVLVDTTEVYLFQKTNKRPIVIPVILGV
ncbi:MAG TPA: ribonuclease J [Candidatus Paceibacterota bacterium]